MHVINIKYLISFMSYPSTNREKFGDKISKTILEIRHKSGESPKSQQK
jgi:hypothetical protein